MADPLETPDTRQKILALVLFVTALATVYVLAVEPLWGRYRNLTEELSAARDQEQRYLKLLARRGEIEAALAAAERRTGDDSLLFSANTPAVAAANLVSRIRDVITTHGGEIRSSITRTPTGEFGLTKVAVTISARLPFTSLTEVLHTIEFGKPYVFIDDLSVRSQQRARPGVKRDFVDFQLTAQAYADVES